MFFKFGVFRLVKVMEKLNFIESIINCKMNFVLGIFLYFMRFCEVVRSIFWNLLIDIRLFWSG